MFKSSKQSLPQTSRDFFIYKMIMVKGIEHIGIAVRNLEEAEERFSLLLGKRPYKREEVESEGVITSFFQLDNVKIELLAATNSESPIHKFIEKRGEGIHHIAYSTDSALTSLTEAHKNGFELIHKVPKDGADNMEIGFLHPRSTLGVLTEFCSPKKS